MKTLYGYLVRTLLNKGSKSEHFGFSVVYMDGQQNLDWKGGDATQIVAYKKGDNPFSHDSLKPFEDKAVKVTGKIIKNRFEIDTIEELHI